jgi:hypothetical protein
MPEMSQVIAKAAVRISVREMRNFEPAQLFPTGWVRRAAPELLRKRGGGGRRLRVFLLRLLLFAFALGHVELSSARR